MIDKILIASLVVLSLAVVYFLGLGMYVLTECTIVNPNQAMCR